MAGGDGSDEMAGPAAPARSSDDPFRLFVETVKDYAIFMLDPSGVVATWNAGAERIKGYRADEIIGRHFSTFYRPEDRWKCAAELEVAIREGRVEDEGYRVRKDGRLFWANVVITAVRDERGRLVGFGKVTRDLTERRRVERALDESEAHLRLLVESVKDYAIFLLDERGYIKSWNAGAERIKGYRAAEIIGRHFSVFYPESDVRAGKCEMELEVAAREGRFEDEDYRLRKDGTRFWANVVITALRDADGRLVGFAKVTRDLTERKKAEEARLEAGRVALARLHLLSDVSEALSSAGSAEDVGRIVVEQVKAFARADDAAILLVGEGARLEVLADANTTPLLRAVAAGGAQPLAAAVASGDPVWLEGERACRDALGEAAAGEAAAPRLRAFGAVPLVVSDKRIGLLMLAFSRDRTFSDDERAFLGAVARQSAQAVARARSLAAERASAALAARLGSSLETTLRSIGDAVIATDAEGRVTLMNGVAESLTRWTEQDARGRPLPEIFHIVNEFTRAVVANPVDLVLATNGIVGLANHTVLIARDGTELPIDDSGAPIRGQGGEIAGVVLVFRDVSVRKQTEARRALLAEATHILGESLDEGATLSRVAELVASRIAGYCAFTLASAGAKCFSSAEGATRERWRQVERSDTRAHDARPGFLSRGASGPELHAEVSDEHLRGWARDDEQLAALRALAIRSLVTVPLASRGKVLGSMTIASTHPARELTPNDLAFAQELAARAGTAVDNAMLYASEQRSRRNAEVANRAKDDFLAMVSHELRTPLSAITGWSQMLVAHTQDEKRRQRALETISRNAIAMAQLVEDLLDMSRVISGKMRLELAQVDLVKVVEAALDSVRPAAAARDVQIITALDAVPRIMGDPTRLQQVVWNLLSNAVKFSARRAEVTVTLRSEGSSLELAVTDSGRGIAPSFLPLVFDPFRQQETGTTRSTGGLGLGLAITRQLVELHGGRIQAQSEGEGRGATFTVRLPVSAVSDLSRWQANKAANLDPFVPPPQLRGLDVLVVDDEQDSRELISEILSDCGCRVRDASSVREALNAIAERPPDLILTDIGMPEHDGYELIRRIRALPAPAGQVPVAALTAYARPEDRRRILDEGFSMHLTKPVEPVELVAAIADLARFFR